MHWKLFGTDVPPWIYAPALLAAWWLVAILLKVAIAARLKSEAFASRPRGFIAVGRALSLPLVLFVFVSGPIALLAWTPLGEGIREKVNLNIILAVVAILAGLLFTDRLLRGLISAYSPGVEVLRTAGGVISGLGRGIIVGLAVLILLDTLGISITPVLASLGIGSLAVALALQPSLENLFAGMQIVMDRPILMGHFIRLESGEEGYVERIGWRSTWIRLLSNNMLIIPNKQLVDSRVINYYYPTKDVAIGVELGAAYGADLERVERVALEVAQAVTKSVEGSMPDHKPAVRFHTFGDARINFSVALRAREFVDHYLLKHEFIKALAKRFSEEGIEIPLAVRAISVTEPEKKKS